MLMIQTGAMQMMLASVVQAVQMILESVVLAEFLLVVKAACQDRLSVLKWVQEAEQVREAVVHQKKLEQVAHTGKLQ